MTDWRTNDESDRIKIDPFSSAVKYWLKLGNVLLELVNDVHHWLTHGILLRIRFNLFSQQMKNNIDHQIWDVNEWQWIRWIHFSFFSVPGKPFSLSRRSTGFNFKWNLFHRYQHPYRLKQKDLKVVRIIFSTSSFDDINKKWLIKSFSETLKQTISYCPSISLVVMLRDLWHWFDQLITVCVKFE